METWLLNSFLLRLIFPLLLCAELIYGNWTLFVKVNCWQGTGYDSTGLSCDVGGDCDQQFLFCLRQYVTSGTSEVCPFGSVETGEFDIGDSFCFGELYIDQGNNIPNPLAFSNEGSYPGRFQLFVNIVDLDLSFHDLIANIFIDRILDPSQNFTSLGTYTGTGSGGSITLQFKVECHDNYYGLDCGTFCMDTNDSTGHYTCSSSGERICLSGWSEPSTNCVTPVCPDCHPIGGRCDAPGSCICQQGWSGSQCEQCLTLNGCDPPDPTVATNSPSTSSSQLTSSPSFSNGTATDDDETLTATTLAAIVGSSVIGILILLVIIILVVGCTIVILKKRKPISAIEMNGISPTSSNDYVVSQPDDISVEIDKSDLSPPAYNDL